MPLSTAITSTPDTGSKGHEHRLRAVMARDRSSDGVFVYAVTSTGIYCRPSCPSRRPAPGNIRFFAMPEAARCAGFRPCRRCRPDAVTSSDPVITRVTMAVDAIKAHVAGGHEGPPRLASIARQADTSPHYLQRRFTELVGLSPRAYADALRLDLLRRNLRGRNGVSDAIYGAGFGSGSRVYHRAAKDIGMTPATYAKGGKGAKLRYACGDSPLGKVLVAATGTGIAFVALGASNDELLRELEAEFPAADVTWDSKGLGGLLPQVLALISAKPSHKALPLDVQGTAFQRRVWQELAKIPLGETRTYGAIAKAIGKPKSSRAVGAACGANPVALVIPCHRAVGSTGALTGYRWGLERKKGLLHAEAKRGK